ncbi:DUF1642 domain-containing protein [Lactococcus cremoris]|uniref:DUF1642 domain-containing protein n=1 Tax=Lactococcus lactis subsp. cremoris TaxID=1359 RepID=UPI0037C01B56
MTKEMKRPISNITQDSIKPLLSNAVEFYTNKNREAHKCIQERDEYINYLESKLSNAKPQQALPVVPDFVAEWYEEEKDRLEFAVYVINTSIYRKYANDRTTIEEWFARADNKPIETVFKMKDGYTVEKPQLEKPQMFYLREKNTGHYLRKTGNNEYEITPHYSNDYDEKYMHYKFTQQEIDSMETGSYEQIEVTE